MVSRRLIYILLVSSVMVYGQSGGQNVPKDPQDQSALIQELLGRLDKMEKRIAELEAKGPSPAPAPEGEKIMAPLNQAEQTAKVAETMMHDHDAPGNGNFDSPYPKLTIRGFADFQFAAQNINNGAGSRSGFQAGQLVLHFSSPLSKKINYFGELSVTQTPSGIFLNLERSIIRYDYNDSFKLSFGQFHTPTSYYNTTYHHGGWLQTTIFRPAALDYLTGPVPQHVLGMSAEGNIPSGAAGLGYMFGIGNGSRGFGGGDIDNNRSLFGELYTRPRAVDGLQIGGSFWTDKRRVGGRDFRQLITAAHLVLKRETPELIVEISNTHHSDILSGQTWNSQMGFLQVAYRLPWNERKWKPYYLFEYINTPATEPIFGVRDLVGSTLGVRYDISDFAAFKLEYRNQKRTIIDHRMEGIFLQTAFTF